MKKTGIEPGTSCGCGTSVAHSHYLKGQGGVAVKILAVLLVVLLAVGCNSAPVSVDPEGAVTVTLPSYLVVGTTNDLVDGEQEVLEDFVQRILTEEQVYRATINEDSSVTVVMSEEWQKITLENLSMAIDERIAGIVASEEEEALSPVISITYSEDYTQFRYTVNRAQFDGSMAGYVVFELSKTAAFYQAYAGAEEIHLEAEVMDEATGEIYQTFEFPKLWL